MKGFSVIVIFLMALMLQQHVSNGQSRKVELAPGYKVTIDNKSFVRIVGRTNVNTFECTYCSDLSYKAIEVGIKQKQDGIVCFDDAIIQLRTNSFDCGLKEMTKDFKELLNEEEHPYITMEVQCLKLDLLSPDGLHQSNVKFTISGISNFYTIPLETTFVGEKIHCLGKKEINIGDFNITPPTKFFGLVKVHETITVEFNIILKIDENASIGTFTTSAGQ